MNLLQNTDLPSPESKTRTSSFLYYVVVCGICQRVCVCHSGLRQTPCRVRLLCRPIGALGFRTESHSTHGKQRTLEPNQEANALVQVSQSVASYSCRVLASSVVRQRDHRVHAGKDQGQIWGNVNVCTEQTDASSARL